MWYSYPNLFPMNILFQKFQQLALAIYRVTSRFPRNEPLKNQMRRIILDILTNFNLTKKHRNDIIGKVDKLRILFEIARGQNWVDFRNFNFLNEYCVSLCDELNNLEFSNLEDKDINFKSGMDNKIKISENRLTDRQKKILNIISSKEKTQFSDLQLIFKDTSPRTLRRDIQILYTNSLIKREGRHPDFFYRKI